MTTELAWKDPQAVVEAVLAGETSSVAHERLLAHFGFEYVTDMPAAGNGHYAVWQHKLRDRDRRLAHVRPTIRHPNIGGATQSVMVIAAVKTAIQVYQSCGEDCPRVTFPERPR